MIEQWIVKEPDSGVVKQCVVCLPGRSQPASFIIRVGEELLLPDTLIVALEPHRCEWYPQPYSADDQQKAVKGLPAARKAIEKVLHRIRHGWGLKRSEIALLGFSAGAVMSVEVVTKATSPWAAAVCLSGAILEPADTPEMTEKNNSAIMIAHNKGDMCFDWEERYLPMRKVLQDGGYRLTTLEGGWNGRHSIYIEDVVKSAIFLANEFGVEGWEHPRSHRYVQQDEEGEEGED